MKTYNDTKSSPTACICCNGEIQDMDGARKLASSADLLIAADGGARYLARMGLKPHAVIGDMDSVNEEIFSGDESIRWVPFPREKDRSDAELAVQWALEQDAARILLLGAMGGRPDHFLGNTVLLMRFPSILGSWDDGYLNLALTAGQSLHLQTLPGALLSMFPFDTDTRVTTTGLKYELTDEGLKYATHGLSNEAVHNMYSVAVTRGRIILCAEGGETWFHR